MNTARKIFPLITLQKQQASANTTLPDCLSSLQIPPITNTLIAKELIMPCCSYPIPIFLSRRQHFSLVSPVFPPFFASSVLSNNVRLRNSAICIFIRKNCRKIPNSCCFRFCSFDTRYNTLLPLSARFIPICITAAPVLSLPPWGRRIAHRAREVSLDCPRGRSLGTAELLRILE